MKKGFFSLLLIPFLLFYALPVGAVEKEERKWQDETIYYIMVDRFQNGDIKNNIDVHEQDLKSYQGGDFQGIINKLDELKEEGFTTIVTSPIFENDKKGYHGYRVTDFYKTEENFGSLKTYQQLIKEAHKREMRVLMEFPAQYISPEHQWVQDASKANWLKSDGKASSYDWKGDLVSINLEHPEARDYMIKVGKWWINKTDIDGYYLSDATEVSPAFWKEFSAAIHQEKKPFFLLAEVNPEGVKQLSQYEKMGLDGLTNPFMVGPLRDQYKNTDSPTTATRDVLLETEKAVANPLLMVNYFDNHKIERFTRDIVNEHVFPGTRWKLALTYLYTIPGIPFVYYGSEIALDGGQGVENHQMMNFRADKELIDYIKKIAEFRQKLPALTRGTYEPLYDKDGMTIYKRKYKDETIIVAINNSSKTQKVTLTSAQLESDKELRGLLDGDLVRSNEDGTYTIIMDRELAEIYALAEKSGINFSYVTALVTVYVLFLSFIFIVWKRGRSNNKQDS
ncbi:glycosidase [Oikeobacillus pervagus]|uniref:Glycosidase n=1 Tax=Oikeobacillus pervagus TaxID=1325931 RepID=A0AAJ1WLX1_9BACI|nr:alpha-amylase family glycosyl hydrolase [Oikeobacillus pervagus]MDQ0216691.1 glycosidase [Oikeobacillus pervagus]